MAYYAITEFMDANERRTFDESLIGPKGPPAPATMQSSGTAQLMGLMQGAKRV